MRHYRTSFKGERPLHEVHEAVGAGGGILTRIHVEGGETRVYFAAADASADEHLRRLGAGKAEELREDEVSRIG